MKVQTTKPTLQEWIEWAQGAQEEIDTNNIKIKYLDCVEPTDKDIAMPDIDQQLTKQGE